MDWARIFPNPTSKVHVDVERDGHGNVIDVQVDAAAIRELGHLAETKAVDRYRDIFAEAGSLGLTVFLTLYHWPLPLWLHDPIACRDDLESSTRRGWLDQGTIVEYAKYAAFAADAFGDLVDLYATINEAPIMSKYGYLHETVHFPPGLSDRGLFLTRARMDSQCTSPRTGWRTPGTSSGWTNWSPILSRYTPPSTRTKFRSMDTITGPSSITTRGSAATGPGSAYSTWTWRPR